MGRYYINIDYRVILEGIRNDFKRQCLEVQLVWLAEMILIHYYLLVLDDASTTLKRIRDYNVFSSSNVVANMLRTNGPAQIYRKLSNFRNTYVHAGSTAAFDLFCDLYNNYQVELMELAQIVGVNINFNCALYKILEKRTIN